ncbi:MAG: hypothetical protein PHN38_04500 [Sulfurospirillaceae bacterium]|nr:hypothetical protein [Sulfurospirillaceae bacterium]MDD3463553.1 hypothetical protein [Sulfurospirillaceae bacterium]
MALERIVKECFWDLNITTNDIEKIIKSDDERQKAFLFEKILLNSTHLLADLKLFDTNELLYLLENFKIPTFNHDYIFRRKNIAEVYFFDKPILIDELKWIA